MKISKYLTYEEATKAPTGVINKPSAIQLANITAWAVNIYDPIVDHFGIAPFVHCVFRSERYNAMLPGASKASQHIFGEAGDIDYDTLERLGKKVPSNKELFDFIVKSLPFDQIIWENGGKQNPDWLHVSHSLTKNRKKKTRKVTGKPGYINFDLY